MKIKDKIVRWGLLGLAFFSATSVLIAGILSISSPHAFAADGSAPLGLTSDQSTWCTASIHKATGIAGAYGAIDSSAGNGVNFSGKQYGGPFLRDGFRNPGKLSAAASKTLGLDTAIYITFAGSNSKYDSACAEAMFLIQSPDDHSKFYGLWFNPVNGTYQEQDATINAKSATLQFNLVYSSFNKAFTIQLADPDHVLTSAAVGGGVGSAADGSCISTVATDADLKKCIDSAGTFFNFKDAATITFGQDTYTASQWGYTGSDGYKATHIEYLLSNSGYAGRPGNGTPEIDIDTTKYDLNLDDLNSTNIQQFFTALSQAAIGGHVSMNLKNFNNTGQQTNYNGISVNSTNINIFARYYPATDQVSPVFTDGGNNEKHFVGNYDKTATGTYTLSSPTFPINGCTSDASKPKFVFNGDPKTASTGSIVGATWYMADSSCAVQSGSIHVLVNSANATPPVAVGSEAAAKATPTCESSGFSLSWIMCPIINGLASAVDGIYGDVIQPLLITTPVATSSSGDPTKVYAIWSQFRIYGDIFLVIALLVIVFGQSLGGGMIDAYTAKKVLPRLLIAAVLINLSIYIVALAVDITNVIGTGIQTLMSQPFANANAFKLKLNGGAAAATGAGLGLAGLVGGGAAGVSIWVIAEAGLVGGLTILAPLLQFLLLFILLPAFLIMLSIMVTILIRRGLIIFLVVVSPVAFALYCLPNTEQYFRKWWDLLFKTLLVYPIVAAIFGIANILSVTIAMGGQSSGFLAWVSQLMSIVALILPLFLIPFAFRIAGGAIGKAHEAFTSFHKRGQEALKGNINDPNSLRNRVKHRAGDSVVRGRSRAVRDLGKLSEGEGGGVRRQLGRRGAAFLGKRLNYGDLEAKASALNKHEGELRELKTGYGPDDSVRALFADDDGISKVSGKKFNAIDIAKARQLYGRTESGMQTAIDYELGKAGNQQEYEQMLDYIPSLLEKRGFDSHEINGIMKGVGYKNQAKYLDLKHTSFTKNKDTGLWDRTIDRGAMAQNAAIDFGQYPISNMKPAPIDELTKTHQNAVDALTKLSPNADEKEYAKYGFKGADQGDGSRITARQMAERSLADVEATAATLDMSSRMGRMQTGEGEGGVPIAGAASGAAGRVDESIQKLVNQVNDARKNKPELDQYRRNKPDRTPRPQPSTRTQDSSSPRIIRPGDDGFNIPPGSRPSGS